MRRSSAAALLVALLATTAVLPVALAHVPQLPSEGETLATATVVEDPAKSWALYGELEGAGRPWYFRMELAAGDRIWLSLLTPEEDEGFAPSLALMGPGLAPEGEVPPFVEVPDGASAVVLNGTRDGADYEPFTPGAYFFTVEVDEKAPADGTYYVAVYDAVRGGAFSLAVGYKEEFSLVEWVGLPVQLARINRWEGEGWALILGPAVATVLGGVALVGWRATRSGTRPSLFQWLAVLSGLLAVGTGLGVLVQMLDAAAVSGFVGAMAITMGFVLMPMLFGGLLVRAGLRAGATPRPPDRLALVVLGVLCLGLLAGYLVGPVLAFAAAALPPRLAAMLGSAPAAPRA